MVIQLEAELGKESGLRTMLSELTCQRLAEAKARKELSANASSKCVPGSQCPMVSSLVTINSVLSQQDTLYASSRTFTIASESLNTVTNVDDDGDSDELRYAIEQYKGKAKVSNNQLTNGSWH
jgi:hypothetical protein